MFPFVKFMTVTQCGVSLKITIEEMWLLVKCIFFIKDINIIHDVIFSSLTLEIILPRFFQDLIPQNVRK